MANESQTLSAADGRVIATELEVPPELEEPTNGGVLSVFEDKKAFKQLMLQIAGAMEPRDYIEWLWVKDVADNTWDILRARRAKAVRLSLARKNAIRDIIQVHDNDGSFAMALELDEMHMSEAQGVVDGDVQAKARFAAILKRIGLTEQSVMDAAYNREIAHIERLQKLVDNAVARRDSILREVDRRRDATARRLRLAIDQSEQIIDAEFE